MEVIVIESKAWKALIEKLEFIENFIYSTKEINKKVLGFREEPLGFATIEKIMSKYNVSRTTINNKSKKYKIERLRFGRQNLINELQLLESLKNKEPKPECFAKKMY